MRVAFVVKECECYSVELFSSILKQHGHEVYLVFDPRLFGTHEISNSRLMQIFDIRRNNVKEIQRIKPDLVGFSIYTQDYRWSLEMARMIKESMDVPIIFGGIHCILVPEEVMKNDCIDVVCTGEGEFALLDLVESMQRGHIDYTIKNLWFRTKENKIIRNELRPLIKELDILPFPDKELLYKQKPIFRNGYSMNSGRGCPYCCTYCTSETINRYFSEKGLGRYVRQRSVRNVIEELQFAKKKYNFRILNFTDDVFALNINWLREFAKEYKKKIDVPFFCTANPGTIKKEEVLLLKEANCHTIGFGLQSACEETRVTILNRRGENKRIKEVSALCHKLKLRFTFDHIFNIPGEGIEEQVEALSFYNETRPQMINLFWITYFPKVKLIDIALEKGFLQGDVVEKINKGEASTSFIIGVGGGYSFGNAENNNTFAFLFAILPFMPKWFCRKIIKKGWYKHKVKLPFLIRLAIKDLSRLKSGRIEEIFFPIQLFFINVIENLKIKIRDRISSY